MDRKRLRLLARVARGIVVGKDAEYGDGKGFCAEWSYVFRTLLRLEGVRCEIIRGNVSGDGHYWVDVDGVICGGTGDQFKCPTIQVRSSRGSRRYVVEGKWKPKHMYQLEGSRPKELRDLIREWRQGVQTRQAHLDLVSSPRGLR